MAESKKNRAIAAELVAKATRDGTFRQQFIADPKAALIAAGAALAQDVQVRVVESTEKLRYIILPSLGDGSDLSQAQLAALAGGGSTTTTTNTFQTAEAQTTAVQTAEVATTVEGTAEVGAAAVCVVVAT